MELTLELVKSTYFIPSIEYLLGSYDWHKETSRIGEPFPARLEVNEETTAQVIKHLEDNKEALTTWYTKSPTKVMTGIPVTEKMAEVILVHLKAEQELNDAEAAIETALSNAMAICDKHKLQFDLNSAYGMGGTYYGSTEEWQSSSQSC